MKPLRNLRLTRWVGGAIRRPRVLLPSRETRYRIIAGELEFVIRWVPWVGRAVVAVQPLGFGGFCEGNYSWEVEVAIKKPKVPVEGEEAGPVNLAAVETKVWGKLGAMVEHVVSTRYGDNSPRRGSLVMIDTLGSAWRVRVTDPDSARRLTCLGPTLDEALALAEAHLRSDDCPWEIDTYAQGGRKKK